MKINIWHVALAINVAILVTGLVFAPMATLIIYGVYYTVLISHTVYRGRAKETYNLIKSVL